MKLKETALAIGLSTMSLGLVACDSRGQSIDEMVRSDTNNLITLDDARQSHSEAMDALNQNITDLYQITGSLKTGCGAAVADFVSTGEYSAASKKKREEQLGVAILKLTPGCIDEEHRDIQPVIEALDIHSKIIDERQRIVGLEQTLAILDYAPGK